MTKKGKLIVLDGADGAGKATQSKLLLAYLKQKKIPHHYLDFPRYYDSFHGQVVGRFLKGEFGQLDQVNPYLASYPFACDRAEAKEKIETWLVKGNFVIANRYTSSNLVFQGARLPAKELEQYSDWIHELEYSQNHLPKEDIVIFLYVPIKISQKLIAKKAGSQARRYTGGQAKDINEADVEYQRRVLELYLKLSKRFKYWQIIDCVDKKGGILSKAEIHQMIISVLKKRKII